jgi:flagellar export protein FliJ
VKSLRTLLRLARRDLETLRRALADQILRQTTLEQRILGHEQTVRAEQDLARRDYESARAYGGYAVAAAAMRRALESERDMIAAEINRLRQLIAAAHIETRKFERLVELQDAREKAARERRENAELDEMATIRAGRVSRR